MFMVDYKEIYSLLRYTDKELCAKFTLKYSYYQTNLGPESLPTETEYCLTSPVHVCLRISLDKQTVTRTQAKTELFRQRFSRLPSTNE